MITTKSCVKIEVDYSEDKTCRFGYTKRWNADKKNATFILMNPSKGSEIKLDNTIVNINNYCVDEEYGSYTILNLFPFMATNPKELIAEIISLYSCENNGYISDKLLLTNDIYIAWGTQKKYLVKKRELENILNTPEIRCKNIMCWKEGDNYPKHLRIISKGWALVPYKFKYLEKN